MRGKPECLIVLRSIDFFFKSFTNKNHLNGHLKVNTNNFLNHICCAKTCERLSKFFSDFTLIFKYLPK